MPEAIVYTSFLLIIILRFTFGERKICSTIKKSENDYGYDYRYLVLFSPEKCDVIYNTIRYLISYDIVLHMFFS